MNEIYSDYFLRVLNNETKIVVEEKRKDAREQIKEYSTFEEIKEISKLRKYSVIAVVDSHAPSEFKYK